LSRNKTKQSKRNTPNTSNNSLSAVIHFLNTSDYKPQANAETKAASQKDKKGNIIEEGNRQEVKANTIAIIAVFVSVILAFVTYLLYKETTKASIENRNEFEIEHRPIIQIRSIDSIFFEYKQIPKIVFSLNNIGKYPARFDSGRFQIIFDSKPDFNDTSIWINQFESIKVYLTEGLPFTYTYNEKIERADSIIYAIQNNYCFAYLMGEVKYLNEVNKKETMYRFNMRLSPFPKLTYIVIDNVNYPIPK